MNKRQAKQTAHAIAHNILETAAMGGFMADYACGDYPHCGPCPRCKDAERIEEAFMDIVLAHGGLGQDHRSR